MKYPRLPLELELAAVPPEEAVRRREGLAVELMSHPGFQFVTALLRDTERLALDALRARNDHDTTQRLLGRLQLVDELRSSLAALLPAGQQPNVAWGDEAYEEWTGPLDRGRQE